MYLFRKNVITDIIESADDWLIFGTVQFGRVTSTNYAIDIFYKLIRSIERKSGSVWLLRLEGDNLIRNIHIHFIISQDGLRASGAKSNLFMLKSKFSALKKEFLSLNRASVKFEEYDKRKAGAFYLSKVEVGVLNRTPSYFDYAEDGLCVKMSGKLKRRYKEYNSDRPILKCLDLIFKQLI